MLTIIIQHHSRSNKKQLEIKISEVKYWKKRKFSLFMLLYN